MINQKTTVRIRAELYDRRINMQIKTEDMTYELMDKIFPEFSSKMNSDMAAVEQCIFDCITEYRRWRRTNCIGQEVNNRLAKLQTQLKYGTVPADTAACIMELLEEYYDDKRFLKRICARFGLWSAIKRFLLIHGDADASSQKPKRERAAAALTQADKDYHRLDDESAKELFIAMMLKVEVPVPGSEKGEPYRINNVVKNWLNNAETVKREVVLRTAFGLHLNDAEAEELLRSGQQDPFDPLSLYDTVIRYALRRSMTFMDAARLYEKCFLSCLQGLWKLPPAQLSDWRGFGSSYNQNTALPDYDNAEQRIQSALSLNEAEFVQTVTSLVRISKEEMVKALAQTSVQSNADAYTSALAAYAKTVERAMGTQQINGDVYKTLEETKRIAESIVQTLTECRQAMLSDEEKVSPDDKPKFYEKAVNRTEKALKNKLTPYVTYLEYARQMQVQAHLQKLLNQLKCSGDRLRLEMLQDELASRTESQCRLVYESYRYEFRPDSTERCKNAVKALEQRTAQLMAYLVDGARVLQKGTGKDAFTDERILGLLHRELSVQRSDLLRIAYFETLMQFYLMKDSSEIYDQVSIPTDEAVAFFETRANALLKNSMYPEVYVRSPLDCLIIHSLCQAEECVRVYQGALPNDLEPAM